MDEQHHVYEDGPICDSECPGLGSAFHAAYQAGHRAGQHYLAGQVFATLPAPTVKVPTWVNGPTRRAWAREGVAIALNQLGLRRS